MGKVDLSSPLPRTDDARGNLIIDQIREALAPAIDWDAFVALVSPDLWRENQIAACALALAKEPRLLWDAYLERYPDVSVSGLHPVFHYLKFGIHEGRELVFAPQAQIKTAPEPKSIGHSGDNSVFLEELFAKLAISLPIDMSIDEIRSLVPVGLWGDDPLEAAAQALAVSRVNWEAYLTAYPDVKSATIPPWRHFVNSGLFEGRELKSWHPLRKEPESGAPWVSIVVANFNNDAYLPKSLDSLRNQTLSDIEIIVVDDCSTDGSREVIEAYAHEDARIRAFYNSENRGTLLCRKQGLRHARGQYVMFADPDDFYTADACEILHSKIAEGYDFVVGGVNVICSDQAKKSEVANLDNWLNCDTEKVYSREEALEAVFKNRVCSWNIWGKIFLKDLALAAYEELEEAFFIRAEDLYGYLAILNHSRHMVRIPHKIYNYNFGVGISSVRELGGLYKRWFNLGETTQAIGRYAARHGLDIDFERISAQHAHASLIKWLEDVPNEEAAEYFELIKRQYGLRLILYILTHRFTDRSGDVAAKFAHCATQHGDRPVKRIGLYYYKVHGGGAETILRHIAALLSANGYDVTLFVEALPPPSMHFPEGVKFVLLRPGLDEAPHMLEHLESLDQSLRRVPIDLMFYAAAFAPYMLWDMIVLHHHRIPVIINYHGAHSTPVGEIRLRRHDREACYRCAAAMTCLSRESELYFRLLGINAAYIPNPVPETELPAQLETENIAVVGRLGDPIKQAGDALLVMREVVKKRPSAKLYLIGDFGSPDRRQECEKKIRELGLADNVQLTGWVPDAGAILERCSVLLSVSYWEAFPMGIAEAQGMGLPCVAYNLDIEQAKRNESIIMVPQRDFRSAAREICALLADEERCKRLSIIARTNALRYHPEQFARDMLELVRDYSRLCKYAPYETEEYKRLIRAMAYYTGQKQPCKWFEERV